jgi:NADH-quinone oxidoreductase subunit L
VLIGHWLEKPEAAKAAQKAFLFNRIGDAAFLIGLMIIWANTHTFNLHNLLFHFEVYSWQTAASLCIFCGVIGKSAQLPLFTWLPDAMEGPTPVSALIHAATMVAAGVFLLARVFILFTPVALNVVAIVGIVTAFMAALSALNQYDIKRILAYSTISQLGLMVTAVGVGAEKAAMLHLFSHAFFKAGLFLAAGSVIHVLHQAQQQSHQNFDPQDIRNLGGLKEKLPFTFAAFAITGASLAGIPFFTGFISKDSILTAIYRWSEGTASWQSVVLILAFIVSFLSVLYTFRMVWFIFYGKQQKEITVSESPWIMRIPLIILSICSVWFVLSINPFDPSGWFTSLIGYVDNSILISTVSALWILIALGTAWFIYSKKTSNHSISIFFQNGFQLDRMYLILFGKTFTKLAIVTDSADRKWIDGIIHFTAYAQVALSHVIAWFDKNGIDGSVNMFAKLAGAVGSFTRSFQSGKIQLYILWSIIALIIFLFFILI